MWHNPPEPAGSPTDRPIRVRCAADAASLLGKTLIDCNREYLRLAHLDREGHPLLIVEQPGGHDVLPIALGAIIRDACQCRAQRLIIAHNHPSGDPTPSTADRLATRRLAELLHTIDVELVDHLIFGRGRITSFRALGLI